MSPSEPFLLRFIVQRDVDLNLQNITVLSMSSNFDTVYFCGQN